MSKAVYRLSIYLLYRRSLNRFIGEFKGDLI
jgi:hypothetical protein